MNGTTSMRMTMLGAFLGLGCNDMPEPAEPNGLPGAIEVSISVTGWPTDSGTHAVLITPEGQDTLPRHTVPYAGGSLRVPDLPVGTYLVRLESPPATCWVTNGNPRQAAITNGETSTVPFTVSCFGAPAVVFNRANPWRKERFILEGPNGIFRMQSISSAAPFADLLGTYTTQGDSLLFDFDVDRQWKAVGTIVGQCLRVEFNATMLWDEFESGEFCSGLDGG
jgi:hypothetical protein